jgi:small GTP-binding protein
MGDPGVGKTSLIRQFVSGKYDEKYITTLGTVISKKIVEFPEFDYKVNLQIWDISGQSEFKRIHSSAFRHAKGAIAVCDVMRPETAETLYDWVKNLHKSSNGNVPVIVIVNKSDLTKGSPKYIQLINNILEYINYPMFTTSAKTGDNVEIGFEILSERIANVRDILPREAEDMVAMPELFENPFALLDYVLARYTKTFGDSEMSMHLIRREVERRGNEFSNLPKEETVKIINKLTEIINNFKGEAGALELRKDFMEAYNRTNW